MLASLRFRKVPSSSVSRSLTESAWSMADQVLSSEGGLTLLFLLPGLITFFLWSAIPNLR